VAGLAALFIALTQAWLLLSGNFSWLKLVTIIIALSAIDDGLLARVLPLAAITRPEPVVVGWHDGLVAFVAVVVLILSYRPARNLLSPDQLMNASFEPLHLVNTYGAFGSITRVRHEVVVEGTAHLGEDPNEAQWQEYEFPGKPTDPKRRPRQWAPYHLRLDWLMWFLALSPGRELSWFLPFLVKLLENDAPTLRLLSHNPFEGGAPKAVRATLYRYRFTTRRERHDSGAWWVRTRERELVRPLVLR
jgi:hypothetical protein